MCVVGKGVQDGEIKIKNLNDEVKGVLQLDCSLLSSERSKEETDYSNITFSQDNCRELVSNYSRCFLSSIS